MAEKPTAPAPTPSMPMNTSATKYHWWYDQKSAGVANIPPQSGSLTGHSPSPPSSAYSILSQSPPGGNFDMNAAATKRRDSLKNMVHLCDFATP